MKKLQNLILRFLFLLIFFAPACGPTYYYTTNPVTGKQERWTRPQFSLPINHKKKKKRRLRPPIAFTSGLRSYRIKVNTFPVNLYSLEHFSKATESGMQSLKENQYTRLKITYWSRDSFQLAWEHPPVYQQYVFGTDMATTVKGIFIFTFNDKDSSFNTSTVFD